MIVIEFPKVGSRIRLESQAPDIDAVVYFTEADPSALRPGEFVDAELVGAREYDLLARPFDHVCEPSR